MHRSDYILRIIERLGRSWPDEALDSYERALRLYGMIEPGSFNVIGLPEAAGRFREIEGRIADGGRRWGAGRGDGAERADRI